MAFDRVKAAGWAAFEALTSTQMNVLDGNVATATDSRLVPDYIGAINVGPAFANDCRMGCYDSFTDSWVYIGGPDGTPVSFFTRDNLTFTAGAAPANTGTWGVRDMASDGAGNVVAVGAVTASISKVRRSTDGGATWSTVSAGAADNADLRTVVWHAPSSLFVAGGDNGLITTSPTGAVWTTRGTPAGWAAKTIGQIATDGAGVLIATEFNAAGVDKYLRATDPTNWATSELAFPANTQVKGVVWSAAGSRFVAVGTPTQWSPTGTAGTWTTTGNIPGVSGATPFAACYRHLILTGWAPCYITTDYGTTYKIVTAITNLGGTGVKFGRGQFVIFHSSTGASRASLRMALT